MTAGLILETTFLVDLERELIAGTAGRAQAFLAARPGEHLALAFTVAAELAAGLPAAERPRWERMIAPFEVLPATADVCWEYGQVFRYLHANGLLISANHLWIAATALAFDRGLVTRKVREFQRVPGLAVVEY
jgi:predicted nucleic acid-binding protein